MKWNVEDDNRDKMIDRPVYSDRGLVTDPTGLSVKDAVVWHDSMSQSLPTLLLHTEKCLLFLVLYFFFSFFKVTHYFLIYKKITELLFSHVLMTVRWVNMMLL